MRAIFLILAAAGCTSTTMSGDDDPAGPDASVLPACDPEGAFGAPVAVGGLDGADHEQGARLSADERTVYFHRAAGAEDQDLFVATRGDAAGTFGTATAITTLNTGTFHEASPSVTDDGLTMVFTSDRGNTSDVFLADRASASDDFQVVSQIVGINTGFEETDSFLARDGSELWFASDRGGNGDLFRATASGSTFDGEAAVAALNTAGEESAPVLTDDKRTIFFARDGAIFSATRASATGTFADVTELTALGDGSPLWTSEGGCRLYLHSDRAGDSDVYVASRPDA